ncbi:beta gene product [Kotonkan virus]|uniref:Beta protein n=1 Tax=Kotonkan virus TaxID=318836 RepID=H8XWF7_9RHAB|nr:beta gene product [Kotonkan virus]AEI17637.1 beta protein [Kotonkan virus]
MRSLVYGVDIRLMIYGIGREMLNFAILHKIIRQNIAWTYGIDMRGDNEKEEKEKALNFLLKCWDQLGPSIYINNQKLLQDKIIGQEKLTTRGIIDVEYTRPIEEYYFYNRIFPIENSGGLLCHVGVEIEGILLQFDCPKRSRERDDCPIPFKVRIIE